MAEMCPLREDKSGLGFAMVARAVFDGVEFTVKEMLRMIEEATR